LQQDAHALAAVAQDLKNWATHIARSKTLCLVLSFFESGTVLIVDRGFCDAVTIAENHGYEVANA